MDAVAGLSGSVASAPGSSQGKAPAPSPDDVRAELERVLASRSFEHAGRSGPLLRYLVLQVLAGRAGELKEYVLATEALGRDASFDPRHDAFVRVEAYRLRTKLRLYYASEGLGDPVVIELPRGRYAPEFRCASGAVPQGPRAAARPVPPPARWRWIASGVLAFAAVAGLALFVGQRLRDASLSRVPRVAVLRFLDLSGEPANQYFTDGVVEELTTALAQTPGLQVIARASAFQFTSKGQDLSEVSRKLDANLIIEGSVRRSGTRARITAQLIRMPGGTHVWAQTFDRDISDVFSLQDEIARAVTDAVARSIGTERPVLREERRAVDPEAYDVYLKGLYLRSQRVAGSRAQARECFERAAAKDPSFAEPHAALGDAYSLLAFHGVEPVDEHLQKALAHAQEALRLDDRQAEAHGVLGFIRFFHDWDWPEAEQQFRRALALNPNLARVRQSYALGLMSRRRFDEAIRESLAARSLDPITYAVSNDYAVILHAARRFDESTREARRTLALDPKFGAAQMLVALNLAVQDQCSAAIPEYQRALAMLPGRPPTAVGQLGYCYAKTGRVTEARTLLAELEQTSRNGVSVWLYAAFIHVGLGEPQLALDCLERAVAAREGDVPFLDVQLLFDELRGQPRFEALRRKIGLAR